jgi:hypothetical protein
MSLAELFTYDTYADIFMIITKQIQLFQKTVTFQTSVLYIIFSFQ